MGIWAASRFWLFWVVMLRACMTCPCVSSCFRSSRVYTQERTCWVTLCPCASLLEEPPAVSHSGRPALQPRQQHARAPASPHILAGTCPFHYYSGCEVVPRGGFSGDWYWATFHVPDGHLCVFRETSLQSHCPFFIVSFFFFFAFCFGVRRILYIFWTPDPYQIYDF